MRFRGEAPTRRRRLRRAVPTIATLLGHTTTRMTERYTHAAEDLHRAVQGAGRTASNPKVVVADMLTGVPRRARRRAEAR